MAASTDVTPKAGPTDASRPDRRTRVAINLLPENPDSPSGAHWFWTRMIPEMASGWTPARSSTCW